MNKQYKSPESRGIEWCDYTWNAVGGCMHECRWKMPDGTIAVCYAEATANAVAMGAYPEGFQHHYWRPDKLTEPLGQRKPAKIFLDSMADLMGHWVPDDQIETVLDVCRQAHWHTFQLLTKNAPRLLKFNFPANVWVGVSSPPDFYMGNELSIEQKNRMLSRSLDVLSQVYASVRWMSIEPLSWDISLVLKDYALDWAIVGAASNGRNYFQPDPAHVQSVLDVLDAHSTPVFFKGNLKWNPHREEYPTPRPLAVPQLSLF